MGFKFQGALQGVFCLTRSLCLRQTLLAFYVIQKGFPGPRAHTHLHPTQVFQLLKEGAAPYSPMRFKPTWDPPPHTCVPCGALPLPEADFLCLLWAGLGWAGRTCSWGWWGHTHLGRSQQIPASCTHPTPHTQGERERKLCFQLSSQTGRRSNSNR